MKTPRFSPLGRIRRFTLPLYGLYRYQTSPVEATTGFERQFVKRAVSSQRKHSCAPSCLMQRQGTAAATADNMNHDHKLLRAPTLLMNDNSSEALIEKVHLQRPLHCSVIYPIIYVNVYLIGTVMLVFGMGLYELFISNLDIAKTSSYGSNLLGLFRLPERPKWLEIKSVNELKTKLGHVIVMVLLIGLFENSIKVAIETTTDLLCFATSILLSSGCLLLLSKLHQPSSKEGINHAPKAS